MLLNGKGFERAPFILTIKDFKMNDIKLKQQDLEKVITFVETYFNTNFSKLTTAQVNEFRAWVKAQPKFRGF